jgi:D-alanyl-D-alanine carboxypeptidase (penicillin-binding protein 5/6)
MNAQAKKLGMNQTNFMNATGLPHPNHYTTANDIIKLAVAFIRDFPEEYKIYSQKEFVWNKIKQTNRNRLLWQDESVDGMKTGHTQSAGYCLVASAKRGDMRLMTVLLGADSEKARAQETQKLLNYGFRFYETHRLYDPAQELTQVRVWRGALDQVAVGTELPIYLTIPRGHYEQLKPIMEIKPNVTAPLKKGDMVGTLTVKLAGEIVASEKLVVKTDVPTGNLFKQGLDQIRLLIGMDK